MKIAISAGLLLGVTHYAAAFPCPWNGGGSSYVYDFTWIVSRDNRGGGGIAYCINELDNRHAQTTCCR